MAMNDQPNGNGRGNGNGSGARDFFGRVTPGNWLTMGVVLVTAAVGWGRLDGQLSNQAAAIEELKASIGRLATTDALANVAHDTDKDMSALRAIVEANRGDFKMTIDALTARVSLLGERTNDTGRETAQLGTEVANLKEAVTELRRQARAEPDSRSAAPATH